jgi:sphingosine kinase/centromere protein J
MDSFESIKVRNVDFTKPLAVIINPNSGKKIDKQGRIETFFKEHNIPYEIHATKQAGDSFKIPLELDFSKYSGLVSCGGDGTYFEVVNGMMEREDGARLPIGIIPNGSGNAGASGLGIRDTQMALEAINTRCAVKQDLYRTLIDATNDDGIPKGGSAFKK